MRPYKINIDFVAPAQSNFTFPGIIIMLIITMMMIWWWYDDDDDNDDDDDDHHHHHQSNSAIQNPAIKKTMQVIGGSLRTTTEFE